MARISRIAVILSVIFSFRIQVQAQDLIHFADKYGNQGYIDASGKEVIAAKYQSAYDFREGLGCVQLNGKFGFIDESGKTVIPLKYDDAQWFSEGLAIVNMGATKGEFSWAFGGKFGYIDKTGKEVISLKYDRAFGFKEGLAAVNLGATRGKYGMEGGKYGYIDKTGLEVIPFIYESAGSFSEGLAAVELNGKGGFIDRTGKEVIAFKYERTSKFENGLACVKLNGKFGFIDRTERPVIPFLYEKADPFFSYGRAFVAVNDKYGFIDTVGKEVIPMRFDDAHTFKEGLASVKLNGKWGFIDTTGTMVIAPRYDYAGYFIDGKADVKADGKSFSIARNDKGIYTLPSELFSPFEVAVHVRNNSVKGLLAYCESLGSRFTTKKVKENTEYEIIGTFENGVKNFTVSEKEIAVSYEFKAREDKRECTDRLKAAGYVPKEIGAASMTMTKDGVDIWMMTGISNSWIISTSSGPGMTQAQLDSAAAVFQAETEKFNRQMLDIEKSNEKMRQAEDQLRKAAEEYMEQKKKQETQGGTKP